MKKYLIIILALATFLLFYNQKNEAEYLYKSSSLGLFGEQTDILYKNGEYVSTQRLLLPDDEPRIEITKKYLSMEGARRINNAIWRSGIMWKGCSGLPPRLDAYSTYEINYKGFKKKIDSPNCSDELSKISSVLDELIVGSSTNSQL